MVWQGNTVYVDTLLSLAALCFAMDFLLLWATSKVAGVYRSVSRLSLGAVFGTVYFVAYVLSDALAGKFYGILQSWPMILFVSFAMLQIALAPLSPRSFLQACAYYYFIAVSAGGAGLAANFVLGWSVPLQLLTAISAILVVSEMGWGVVQKSIWRRLYHLPLHMTIFGQRVSTTALLDTGNRLKDPLSGGNVVIVELEVIKHMIPETIARALQDMSGGHLEGVSRLLMSSQWSSRFRIVPFRSLGREHGLLIGFRPDDMTVTFDGENIPLPGVTIGIYHRQLDTEGGYHALLHPDVLQSISQKDASRPIVATGTSKGESPHAPTM